MSGHGHSDAHGAEHGHEAPKPVKKEKSIADIHADMNFLNNFVANNELLQNELLANPDNETLWKEKYQIYENQEEVKKTVKDLFDKEIKKELKISGFEIPKEAYEALEKEIEQTVANNPDKIKKFVEDWKLHLELKEKVKKTEVELYKIIQEELPEGSKIEAARQLQIFEELIAKREAYLDIEEVSRKKSYFIFKSKEDKEAVADMLTIHDVSSIEEAKENYFKAAKEVKKLSKDTKHPEKLIERADDFAKKYAEILARDTNNRIDRAKTEMDEDALHVFGRFELAQEAMEIVKASLAKFAEEKIYKKSAETGKEVSKGLSTAEAEKNLQVIAGELTKSLALDSAVGYVIEIDQLIEELNSWSKMKKDGKILDAEELKDYSDLLKKAFDLENLIAIEVDVEMEAVGQKDVKNKKDSIGEAKKIIKEVISDLDSELLQGKSSLAEAEEYFDKLSFSNKVQPDFSGGATSTTKAEINGVEKVSSVPISEVKVGKETFKIGEFVQKEARGELGFEKPLPIIRFDKHTDGEYYFMVKDESTGNLAGFKASELRKVDIKVDTKTEKKVSAVSPLKNIGVLIADAKKYFKSKPDATKPDTDLHDNKDHRAGEYLEIRETVDKYIERRSKKLDEIGSKKSYVKDFFSGIHDRYIEKAIEMIKKEVDQHLKKRKEEIERFKNDGTKLGENQHVELMASLKKILRLVGNNKHSKDIVHKQIETELGKLTKDKDLKHVRVFVQGVLSEFKKL